jgi:hypothetical protein
MKGAALSPFKVTATDPAYQLTVLGIGDIRNTLSGVTEVVNPKGDGKVLPRSVPTDPQTDPPHSDIDFCGCGGSTIPMSLH